MSRPVGRVFRVPVSACRGGRVRVFARSFRPAASRGCARLPLPCLRPRCRCFGCFRPLVVAYCARGAFRPAWKPASAFSPVAFLLVFQPITGVRRYRVFARVDSVPAVFARAGVRPAPRAGTRARQAPSRRRETQRFSARFPAVAPGILRHASLPDVHRQCTWRALLGTGSGSGRRLPPARVPPVHFT